MLRYIRALSDKDLALDRSMIPLGSCTMKLNATSEMIPITWPEFANIHPFAPADQLQGYPSWTSSCAPGCARPRAMPASACSPTPAARANTPACWPSRPGTPRAGTAHRNICLIPSSAHGTNPASAQMAGLQVVVTKCDENGNVDMADLKAKCEQHSANLAAVMITYPSTHGVFETTVKELCALVHQPRRPRVCGRRQHERAGRRGRPGRVRRRREPPEPAQDLLHPARRWRPGRRPGVRGGRPGALPARPRRRAASQAGVGAVSAAPLGNAAVLPISWMYMPHDGRRRPEARHRGRHPERQLHQQAPEGPLPHAVRQRKRPCGPRVHPGPAPPEGHQRRDGRGRRQAPDGLRLPRAHAELPVSPTR